MSAILGFAWTTYTREVRLLIVVLLSFIAVYLVMLSGHPRMKVGLMPIVIMFSADGCRRLERFFRQWRGRKETDRTEPGVRVGTPKMNRNLLIRGVFYVLATGVFIYISIVDVLAVAQKVFP